MMDTLVQDLRYGLRRVWSSKGFSTVVVLTLGLAIGANSTLFTLVRHTLLGPIPFRDTDELVFVSFRNDALSRVRAPVSFPDFVDLRNGLESFQDLAAVAPEERTLSGLDEPVRVGGFRASAEFLPLMGVELFAGRGFLPEEDRPGAPRVAILGYGAWERRFGADRSLLGGTIEIDGEPHTVVGILSPEMELGGFRNAEVWTPLALRSSEVSRDARTLIVGGRLDPGVSVERAGEEIEALSRKLAEEHPFTNGGWTAYARTFNQAFLGPNIGTVFALLLLTVVFVLLIACSNVANMLLARGAVRAKEVAVRSALGAGRLRIVRQLLTESAVLSVLGAVVGLALTHATFRVLGNVAARELPMLREMTIDPRVFAFTMVLALMTPLVFGLLPALRASKADFGAELKSEGRGGRSRLRGRGFLVAAEVAMALVLLIVAGLAVRSMQGLARIELGFDPDDVLTMTLDLPEWQYAETSQLAAFFEEAEETLALVPGVREVGFVSHRPIVGGEPNRAFRIEGREVASPADAPSASTLVASPEFFSVMRIPLLRGRLLADEDTATRRPVALISRATAERYWPGEDPVGERVRLGVGDEASPVVEIIGVVGDVRNPDADQPPEPHLYLPLTQNPTASMAVVAKTSGDAEVVAAAMRNRIWEIDPRQPVEDVRTMSQILYDDFSSDYAVIGLVAYFALLALALAAAGIYGVVSYAVNQRAHEIGVRMALGAQATNVLVLVLKQSLVPVALGAAVGLAGALGLSRVMVSLFYGVTATDPTTYLMVGGSLAVIALVASLVPAVRATSGDPLAALRHD